MLQKKICMVGMYGTGKTCLVQRYVHSLFSVKYLTTVGVKIDRREVQAHGHAVTLVLWDLEGREESRNINPSYLKGAHGVFYVVDGTRRETFEKVFEIHDLVTSTVGDVPGVVALNKSDLADQWQLQPADDQRLAAGGYVSLLTSAKTGVGVEEAFQRLADATVAPTGARR
jgi:small GTP-binding protein